MLNVANSVNQALGNILDVYLDEDQRGALMTQDASRNGPVWVFDTPIITRYTAPQNRVLLSPTRNCHPFFHLFESLWMLAGCRDVAFVSQFVKRMETFSDDGEVFNGAYGWRWRYHFGVDQIIRAIDALRREPTSRRVVIAMWDGSEDLRAVSKDIPCNTQIFFRVRMVAGLSVLDMTVTNRSNDILWGAYGANAVHMSILHEFVASALGVVLGSYYQFSNNLHIYTEVADKMNLPRIREECAYYDPLRMCPPPLKLFDMTEDPTTWVVASEEIIRFVQSLRAGAFTVNGWTQPIITDIAIPMWFAWRAYKNKRNVNAYVRNIRCPHWSTAVQQWFIGKGVL